MRHYKSRIISGIITLVAIMAVSCNDTNYDIGSNYLPAGQQTTRGTIDIWDDAQTSTSSDEYCFSTKLYRTDRISSVSISRGLFGVQRDKTFGKRSSRFFSQYTPGYYLEEDGFGYEPFADSVLIFLCVTDFSGDTTQMRSYNVYEVVDDSFLVKPTADTIFNVESEYPAGTFSDTPLFTFDYPNQEDGVYTTSTYVKARIESAGVDFLDRLMLKKGVDGSQINYKYYNDRYEFGDFVEAFKGLYIAPANDDLLTASGDDGSTYSVDFAESGFAFYGRNRYEADPSIIADTIAMTYVFRDENSDVGGVSINSVERDYSQGLIDIDNVSTNEKPSDNTTSTIQVEGMGGVLTELTLGRALFEKLEEALKSGGDDYKTIFFNVAKLMIYIESVDEYDVPLLLTPNDAERMMNLPIRLGLYDLYSTYNDEDGDGELKTAVDYDYYSEAVYGYVSDFDGSLNRSLGCYVMNIPFEMQERWTEYSKALEAAGGDASKIDWDEQEWTRMYIGPQASDLFSPKYVSLQGEADGVNGAPIRLNVTYTLLK